MNKKELILFLSGIVASGLIAWLLTLTNIWQLVIIAGLVAGVLNYSMGRGCLSGGIGVFVAWGIIMLHGVLTENSIALLNAFGGLLGLSDIAWILILIISILGAIFGVLGGALGGGLIRLIVPKEKRVE